ncbi:Pre-mRNA cleavage complex II protein Clp1-domain-containing protein [Lipomyces oligophaga]|uniref:Pre-mRNA cleavage complex II protein Clp1-domain-containing protein n=1 Tax=Lipomyces oligophaga TaxID=45792 RepID=UPI0034CDF59D
MDLPGLQHDESASNTASVSIVHLHPRSEWRFEVGLSSSLSVKLLNGTAEIFGTELITGQTYSFRATKLCIYTWYGCSIEWSGEALAEYTSDESAMHVFANLHFALEKMRAQAGDQAGPRVLIVGPRSSGKTSLAKILTAYAAKMRRAPIAVSLDPKDNMLSLPGSLSAASFSTMIDVEDLDTWGSSATTGPMHIPPKYPIVYYYGSDSPADNPRYYKSLLFRLSQAVASRMSLDRDARSSGTIIDTATISDQKLSYDLIDSIVNDFSVSVVVSVGNERLYNDLLKRFSSRPVPITVVKVQRSPGVVEIDDSYGRSIQQRMFKQYFYGPEKMNLSAFTITADITAITVYRRSEQSHLVGSSTLPIGTDESIVAPTLITKMEVSAALQNTILAVLFATSEDSESDIAEASVMGFVHVLDVDETKKKMKILMPIKTRLPARVLMMGNYQFLE